MPAAKWFSLFFSGTIKRLIPYTHIVIRSEDISIIDKNNCNFENIFNGTIEKISSYGIYLNISVVTDNRIHFEIIVPRIYMRDHKLEIKKDIVFGFPSNIVHSF